MNAKIVVCAVAFGLISAAAHANSPVVDVHMNASGAVRGVVVNQAGQPAVGKTVSFVSGTTIVATAKTDARGRFEAKGLKPGLHFTTIDGSRGQGFRVWTAEAAPPKSSAGVLLVTDPVLRGNGKTFGMSEALVTAGAVGGVIALATTAGS